MSRIEELWHVPWTAAICEVCDWAYLIPVGKVDAICPHCYQDTVTPLPEDAVMQLAAPEMIVPFSVSAEKVRANAEQFAKSIPFRPADLSGDTLHDRLQPVFLPFWLVDSDVQAVWQAETGFDYNVVSHEERYQGGRWQTIEKQETRIRWEPRIGRLQRHYDNIPAPALEEHDHLARLLGRYDTEAAQTYAPTLLQEALVRLPNRNSADAWPDAEPILVKRAADECRQAAAAQHVRQFQWQSTYADQQWTQMLVPVFTSFYRNDEGQPMTVLFNGQSGRISGVRHASMQRARQIALYAGITAVLLFVLAVMLLVFEMPFAGLVAVLAAAAVFGAIYPIIAVAQFNRAQRDDWFAMQTRRQPE
ncbi:MAG: hypothetical protein M9930_00685 [Anaerolineae bacterium]|nr:hypothetical protein [Anaerolineae bacterium]